MLSVSSFWTASESGASPAAGFDADVEFGVRMCGGRRCKHNEKSGEGKTVSALTRILVVDSSRVRCGLNWYLDVKPLVSLESVLDFAKRGRREMRELSDRANKLGFRSAETDSRPQCAVQVIGNVYTIIIQHRYAFNGSNDVIRTHNLSNARFA